MGIFTQHVLKNVSKLKLYLYNKSKTRLSTQYWASGWWRPQSAIGLVEQSITRSSATVITINFPF